MSARDVIAEAHERSWWPKGEGVSKLSANTADSIITALRAAGYALVPVEPTEAMCDAGTSAAEARSFGYADIPTEEIWAAMISAAKDG